MAQRGRKPKYEQDVDREVEAKIWELFQRNPESIEKIADGVNRQLQPTPALKRTDVYPFLRKAAAKKRLIYVPDSKDRLAASVRERFSLTRVDVVRTTVLDDVSYRAAKRLLRLVEEKAKNGEKEVHIGFSGGYTTKKLVQILAHLLTDTATGLPHRLVLVFHALVAGFDPSTPGTDPTSFFTYLDDPAIEVKTRFVLLHAAPLIEPERRDATLKLPGVRDAHEAAKSLDIIVTSAAEAKHQHSMLDPYYAALEKNDSKAAGMRKRLTAVGWIGDMLWLPFGADGPIDMTKYPYEALSLVELTEFPKYIEQGKVIMLVVGPCAHPGCRHLKNRILEAILEHRPNLVSHLVVDSRTASTLPSRTQQAAAASQAR